jgi:hypothetical protein
MTDASTVFDVVDRLAETHPLRVEPVAAVTGIGFSQDPAQSNVAKAVCLGGASPDGAFSAAVLQYPTSPVWGTAGLLELTVGAGVAIAQADIVARFGPDHRIVAPTARQPQGSPVALMYVRPEMRVSFFVSPGDWQLRRIQFVERDKSE